MVAAVPPNMMPLALAAAFMFALAGWLLWLDVGKTVNRVFAALLAIRATSFVLAIIRQANLDDPGAVYRLTTLGIFAILPLFPISVYFLCVYPRRRWLGKWRYGGLATVVFTFASLAWYALDSTAYGVMRAGKANSFNAAADGYYYDPMGPLVLFNGLRMVAFGIIALVLALDYARSEQGGGRNAVFLVMTAFVLNGLNDGVRELIQRINNWEALLTVDLLPWTWGPALLPLASLAPTLAAVGVVAWHGLRHVDAGPRKAATGFLIACALPVLLAYIIEARLGLGFIDASTLRIYVLSIWRLFVPILVTYALLRYGIFDIDLKVKAGLRRTTILVMFGLTFFVVSEAAEFLVSDGRGPVFGLVAAGVLASANRPIERLAHHAADRLMPSTKPLDQLTLDEKHRLYQHQLDLVYQDEGVSNKERRMLDQLALALGFSEEEKEALERGNALHVQEAPVSSGREKARGSALVRAAIVALSTAAIFGVLSQVLESLVPLSNAQAGLVTAGAIALLLGKIEGLAARLSGQDDGVPAEHEETLRAALREAWSDGVLSARDRQYLGQLETELGILPGQRLRIERRVRRELRAAAT